jgi:hypothetical protein
LPPVLRYRIHSEDGGKPSSLAHTGEILRETAGGSADRQVSLGSSGSSSNSALGWVEKYPSDFVYNRQFVRSGGGVAALATALADRCGLTGSRGLSSAPGAARAVLAAAASLEAAGAGQLLEQFGVQRIPAESGARSSDDVLNKGSERVDDSAVRWAGGGGRSSEPGNGGPVAGPVLGLSSGSGATNGSSVNSGGSSTTSGGSSGGGSGSGAQRRTPAVAVRSVGPVR